MYYIAIDVSKRNLLVYDGRRQRRFVNGRGLEGFRRYLESNFRMEEVVLIFEPTGPYSSPLLDLAARLSLGIYVVNPAQAHFFSKAIGFRSKTDSSDVRSLYEFGKLLASRGIKPAKVEEGMRRVWSYLSSYCHFRKLAQALRNHLEAISFSGYVERGYAEKIREEAERLEGLAEEAFERAREWVLADEGMREGYDRLRTIAGIGEKTALWLVWFFSRYSGAGRRQIVALCGLDVVEKQSGASLLSRPHISKKGHSAMRSQLYFPTLTAIKHNPAIAAFYQKLLRRGKKRKLAVIACMRKQLLLAYAIWKSSQNWDKERAVKYASNLSLDFQDSI